MQFYIGSLDKLPTGHTFNKVKLLEVIMKQFFAIVFLLALPLLTVLSQEKNDGKDISISQKALEITKDKTLKAEKIISLYSFVKDQISEIKTQYG